ncbi:MAG: class I tRNA ligase family protein, partial [Malacoplasma sp.]|nr:class I tRNA ligase family protein [Malacoplasma sp.]
MIKMESKYNHKECELNSDLLKIQLEKNKLSRKAKDNFFSVLMPPPNVTGKLHIGHAWNGTIQDCLIRYMNLSGKNSLWLAGMDHAGIATQTKYESFLRSESKKLPNSRTKRIADLKEWVKSNADWIRLQWKKMGFALDYEKEMFTLNDLSNKNVEKVFVDLYKKNLIYKDKKLVNWDTFLKTAISNIEVIKKESKTHMYYIKYWLENKTDFLTVATTRPETIFVDECLVVNPKDKRYQKLIGKNVINPLTNK